MDRYEFGALWQKNFVISWDSIIFKIFLKDQNDNL